VERGARAPRYNEAAAKLAWERIVGSFKTNLA
jgi:dienelactone hydrolase